MVALWGHLAMGLLFALPTWVLWDGRSSAAFVALVLATVTLPDLDLVLQDLGLPVKHHGAMHTVAFVVAFAAIAGLVATAVLRPVLVRWYGRERDTVRRGSVYLFVTGAFALGGLSHLFADVLGADDYPDIEPLWPILEEPVAVDLAHYTATWLNAGLLVVAVALHLVLFSLDALPLEHRYRFRDPEV